MSTLLLLAAFPAALILAALILYRLPDRDADLARLAAIRAARKDTQ